MKASELALRHPIVVYLSCTPFSTSSLLSASSASLLSILRFS